MILSIDSPSLTFNISFLNFTFSTVAKSGVDHPCCFFTWCVERVIYAVMNGYFILFFELENDILYPSFYCDSYNEFGQPNWII